jgi:hypothetical protein
MTHADVGLQIADSNADVAMASPGARIQVFATWSRLTIVYGAAAVGSLSRGSAGRPRCAAAQVLRTYSSCR